MNFWRDFQITLKMTKIWFIFGLFPVANNFYKLLKLLYAHKYVYYTIRSNPYWLEKITKFFCGVSKEKANKFQKSEMRSREN